MRILLLNDVASPRGGAEVFSLQLREALRARGHDARLMASSAGLGGPSPADYTCFGTLGRSFTLSRTANPSAALHLRRALAGFRPDVVHVRMFMTQLSPLVLPLLRGVPTIYSAAVFETICPTTLKLLPDGQPCHSAAGRACRRCLSPQAWTALMLQRRLWNRWHEAFDLVVANSDAMQRRLVEHGIGPTVRLYNGIPERAPRPPLAGPPEVAYAGRLSREKGVDVLVRAFTRVVAARPDARLVLIGDGPERRRLEGLVEAEGIRGSVAMTGHLPREGVEARLDRAWVQVAPSVVEESFGIGAAEAMMRGTAVVASALGGLAETIRDDVTGLLVPPGDPQALAEALLALVGDRDRAERFGAAGRERATEHFGMDRCVDGFVQLYERVRERVAA